MKLISKKNTDPYNILYFSFDEENVEINQLIKNYEIDFLKDKISKTKTYIFLDEIQKLDNWPSKVKILYDMYPKMKIFLSGSDILLKYTLTVMNLMIIAVMSI